MTRHRPVGDCFKPCRVTLAGTIFFLRSIRIHTDYGFITASDVPTTNMIKRLVNISTLVFYNMITVERL